MTDFTDQLALDVSNVFLQEWSESVTYIVKGATSGTAISAIKRDTVDPGDPTPELRAARFTVSTATVTSPAQGDRFVDGDSVRWLVTQANVHEGMAMMDCRVATVAAYTTAEAVSVGNLDVIFRFFVGALDNRENALIILSNADVSDPNEGDYLVISGETNRWYVNDVRERDDLFELRVIRTKARS